MTTFITDRISFTKEEMGLFTMLVPFSVPSSLTEEDHRWIARHMELCGFEARKKLVNILDEWQLDHIEREIEKLMQEDPSLRIIRCE